MFLFIVCYRGYTFAHAALLKVAHKPGKNKKERLLLHFF